MKYEIYATLMSDTPVPDFGPAGPDLEGWDQAMEEWEPEEQILATFDVNDSFWVAPDSDVMPIIMQTVQYFTEKFRGLDWEVDYRKVTQMGNDWIIVYADGEWQVSDGPVGNRSTSYDFNTKEEAEECLERLRGNG